MRCVQSVLQELTYHGQVGEGVRCSAVTAVMMLRMVLVVVKTMIMMGW